MTAVNIVSAHDFLHNDRHQKLYPDVSVYLEGDAEKIGPLIDLLDEGKTALEICQALKLRYRGDALFATLLVYFFIRDALVIRPSLKLEIPRELMADFPRYEAQWKAHRTNQRVN